MKPSLTRPLPAPKRRDQPAETRLLKELAHSTGGVSALARLAALGQLNGGVVHDLNNLLAVMLGYANLLLASDLEPDSEASQRAEEIRSAAVRAQGLTRELLSSGSDQLGAPARVDPARVVRGLCRLLDQTTGSGVDLELDLGDGTPKVEMSAADLERSILNLVLNAREAMPDGGVLRIESKGLLLRKNDLAGYRLPACGRLAPGPYALLTITDSGSGMDEITCAKVLQPYFTTKQDQTGKGLGLATVANLVTQASGAMSISSSLGQGTKVFLWLPVAG